MKIMKIRTKKIKSCLLCKHKKLKSIFSLGNLFVSNFVSKNKITLIDMEIYNDTGSLIVTWRVKKSKERYYVIDLLVADISIVVTKRSEFNSMLKNVNYSLKEVNIILEKQNETSYQKLIN